jgi:hypothetical protein
MSRSVFFLVAGWALASCVPLVAQDAVLGQIYGNGVHAYFGQDYLRAHQLFTSAIDGHSQDPRCFYFRGLTLLRLGRPQDAEIDFQRGAKLESSSDSARAYNVARSLERVQGPDRSVLEQYRMEARMAVLKKAEDEHRLRYQEGLKEQREFLQRQSEAGPARTVESPAESIKPVEVPSDAAKAAGAVPAATRPPDPFSEEGKAGGAKRGDAGGGAAPAELPKPDTVKPDAGSPFGDTGAARPDAPVVGGARPDAAKPAANVADPFGGGDDKKPAAPPAGAAKPAAGAGKRDAAKPGTDADPFGDEPPAKAGGKAAEPAAAADTPFVDESDKAPAKKAVDAKKPAAAKKPAEDKNSTDADPFGG